MRKLSELMRMNPGDLKRLVWYRLVMGGAGQNDPFKQLNRMYMLKDPGRIDAPGEHPRHQETNRVLESVFGRVGTMLEVGSGEGVQSEYLSRLCDRLTGLETSPRAFKRAKKRVPTLDLLPGQLAQQTWAGEMGKFDVVVAAEVINHMGDVPAFLDNFSRLGRGCLVTFFAQNRSPLDPIVNAIPGVQTTMIRFGDKSEKQSVVAWWAGCRENRMAPPGENALMPRPLSSVAA